MKQKFSNKELLVTYKTISRFMEEYGYTKDTSFVRVKNLMCNILCDQLDEEILC